MNGALPAYQRSLVELISSARSGTRVLLRAPTGSGKTTTIAMAVGERRKRIGSGRLLVVAPRAVHDEWTYRLKAHGIPASRVDGAVLRRIEANTPADANPWDYVDDSIVSLGFLSRNQRWQEAASVGWDFVAIDEFHLAEGGAASKSAVRGLWESNLVETLVGISSTPISTQWLDQPPPAIVNWPLSEILGLGTTGPESYEPVSRAAPVDYSDAETKVWSLLRRGTLEYDTRFLWRRAASSFYALAVTCRRVLAGISLEEMIGSADTASQVERVLSEDEGPFDADSVPSEDEDYLDFLRSLLDAVEGLTADSKWTTCREEIRRTIQTPGAVAVVSDYADTADYIAEVAREESIVPGILTGRTEVAVRTAIAHQAISRDGLLIATPAGLSDMQIAGVGRVVHYDLPWNPLALYERLLVFAQTTGDVEHVFLTDTEGASDWALPRVLEQIAELDHQSKDG